MKQFKKKSVTPLGYKTPEGFFEQSKKSIKALPRKKNRQTISFVSFSAAASFLLLVSISTMNFNTNNQLTQWEEDEFVTDLLMETLVMEETQIDAAIEASLIANFENENPLKP